MAVRSVGVEEEFLLLRAGGTTLAPEGDAVVESAGDPDDDAQFERELKQAQAELGSSPTRSLEALAGELTQLRARLAGASARHGIQLIASGTSPVAAAARTTAGARYRDMMARFGQIAEQQLTCGMHIHVDIASRAEGVRVLDGMAPWLPVLRALSANSPFYGGRDTSYASYRSILWGQWPSAGPPAAFDDVDTYERVHDDLIAVGAARDTAMIYFDARLSASYPTVEIRACDVCAEPEDAAVIAGLARALVEMTAGAAPARAARPEVPRGEVLRAASWRAARWGMSGMLVDLTQRPSVVPAWDLVDTLIRYVTPALEASGDVRTVTDGLAHIRRRGTGADAQRRAYARAQDFADVVAEVAVAPMPG